MRTFKGMSGYAIRHPKFPWERFLKQYPKYIKRPGLPVIYKTFGVRWEGIDAFCQMFSDRLHLVEIHMSNGARRRKTMYRGEFCRAYNVAAFNKALINEDPKVIREIRKATADILEHKAMYWNANTKLIISCELEDNLSDEAYEIFFKTLRVDYSGPILRSPCMGGHQIIQLGEKHGRSTTQDPRYICNLDGVSVNFEDGESYFDDISVENALKWAKKCLGCKSVFYWNSTQQGVKKASGFGNWPPPKERTFEVTDNAIDKGHYLLRSL